MKSPEEKAKEIFEKLQEFHYDENDYYNTDFVATKNNCNWFADQIIKQWELVCNDENCKHFFINKLQYWLNVKLEINKL